MTHRSALISAGILRLLQAGPATSLAMAVELGARQRRVRYELRQLSSVVDIGSLAQADAAGVKVRHTDGEFHVERQGPSPRVYALAGTRMLRAPVAERELEDEVKVRRPKSKSGSGVIAGRRLIRGYVF